MFVRPYKRLSDWSQRVPKYNKSISINIDKVYFNICLAITIPCKLSNKDYVLLMSWWLRFVRRSNWVSVFNWLGTKKLICKRSVNGLGIINFGPHSQVTEKTQLTNIPWEFRACHQMWYPPRKTLRTFRRSWKMLLTETKWKLKYACLPKEGVSRVILLCWHFNGVDILMEGNESTPNLFSKTTLWLWSNSDVFHLPFWMSVWKVWKSIEISCVKSVAR